MHPVQQHRERAGLTLAALAGRTGLAVSTIRDIEQGITPFKTNIHVARILAAEFNCHVEDLFDPAELSHLGRPPLTGRPIGYQTKFSMKVTSGDVTIEYTVTHEQRYGSTCPNCFVVTPVTGICDDCGWNAAHPRKNA